MQHAQKYSKLFGKTAHGEQGGSQLISHQLLMKGGFIRESSAGRYYFLPLGWRVHERIKAIVKQEMEATGAQEMITPVLHPLELWEETNRTSTVGFELMTIADQRGAKFALGGTAEEMFVDLVRALQLSYKDLPFNIYQFSTKFRDEKRARGGLLRMREFVMKDAYSFHRDAEDFATEYETMARTYEQVFARCGLQALKVAADNGYIGGEYCHEFQVESEVGEGRFFVSDDGTYVAHEDIATFKKEAKNLDEAEKPLEEVEAVRGTTMEDGVSLHNLPLWQQIKDVLFVDERGRFILAILRGDFDVNETKLKHATRAVELRPATAEEIRDVIHSEPGFISPAGIKDQLSQDVELVIVADDSLRTIKNAYGGANQKHRDLFNMNIDRDYHPDIETDIAMAQDGYSTPEGSILRERRGIEVGNIFQLGTHYTTKMHNATFAAESGPAQPFYMGCYGIGLARTLATIVEKHHDDRGICWPASVAPYVVHLISLKGGEEGAEQLFERLAEAGIPVLWDERDSVSPGKKFTDADLIGCPLRVVSSARTAGAYELKARSEAEVIVTNADKVLDHAITLAKSAGII